MTRDQCDCTAAEAPECHAICPMAGHQDGICEQCDPGEPA